MSSAPEVAPRRIRTSAAAAAALVTICALTAACGSSSAADDASASIVRVTTNIAGAGVIGLNRTTSDACPAPAPVDPTGVVGSTRTVLHAQGTTAVPADPLRIVVLDAGALDAACALGVWERVVGVAVAQPTSDPAVDGPSYLGSGIAKITSVGSTNSPNIGQIGRLHPDLIIGPSTLGADTYRSLDALAPTVFTDSPDWKQRFIQSGAAMGRGASALAALGQFHEQAVKVEADLNAVQTQASVVRFGSNSIRVDGTDSFAGEVLAEVGVQRPPRQQGTSFDIASDDVSAAEGDLIYVHFDGADGKAYGTEVLRSAGWESLGASTDGRVFAVDDAIWGGDGVVAARAMLADLVNSLNGYVQ